MTKKTQEERIESLEEKKATFLSAATLCIPVLAVLMIFTKIKSTNDNVKQMKVVYDGEYYRDSVGTPYTIEPFFAVNAHQGDTLLLDIKKKTKNPVAHIYKYEPGIMLGERISKIHNLSNQK